MLQDGGTERFTRPDLLPERIAQHLRGKIAGGLIRPGERLTEQLLVREYEVSRVPLREALRILASEGLIKLSPHRGATVVALSENELLELFGVRSAIEEFAARALAEKGSSAVIEQLRDLHSQTKIAVATGDIAAYEHVAIGFHEALVNGCGNALLGSYYEQIKNRLRRYQTLLARRPKSCNASIREHERMIVEIARGSSDKAAEATRTHIRNLIGRFQADLAFSTGEKLPG